MNKKYQIKKIKIIFLWLSVYLHSILYTFSIERPSQLRLLLHCGGMHSRLPGDCGARLDDARLREEEPSRG